MAEEVKKSWPREIVDPFVDLAHAPRALWGVNLAYTLEGLSYFGFLTYLAIYFSDFVFKGVVRTEIVTAEEWSQLWVAVPLGVAALLILGVGLASKRVGWQRALVGVAAVAAIHGLNLLLNHYFSAGGTTGQQASSADEWSHMMVGVLTAGIAISMVLFGFVPDKIGVRRALIVAFVLLLSGRILISAAPGMLGLEPNGLGSALHLATMGGILLVVVGYGLYQPAAYSAVRQFTTPKTASMAYAMLYALMNAGSSLLIFAFVLRDEKFLGLGISGAFWVFTGVTVLSLLSTYFILSKKTVEQAITAAKAATAAETATKATDAKKPEAAVALTGDAPAKVPVTAWIVLAGVLVAVVAKLPHPWQYLTAAVLLVVPFAMALSPERVRKPVVQWFANHPLGDAKFFFFIFALMPVQTLFTYNWLILPQYISRAYEGRIGEYFEIFSNLNPIMIFIAVPAITALTYKVKIYNMMVWGTLVMASSAFVLAFGSNIYTLSAYLVLMTIGEAMWSARFLQYATEIAPEGRAGMYQGVAQLPWFLTKALVPILYSGRVMELYCPAEGAKNTEHMWLIFGLLAITTPIMLILAKRWVGKDFKARAA